AAPPLLLTLWTSIPAFQPAPQTISGIVSKAEVCLVTCAQVVAIGNEKLVCQADFFGAPHPCRDRHVASGEASVRYVTFPSLAGLVGLAPTTGVLVRMEREGKVTFSKSISDHAWSALYGGWVFHAFYWPIMGFIIWKWPKSWLSRRVTWEDVKDPSSSK
ncbi:MAG: hypothetical protein ACRDAM_04770, partial [Casimicrobium sp.]